MRYKKIKSSLVRRFVVRRVDLWNADRVQADVDITVVDGKVVEILPHSAQQPPAGFEILDGRGFVVMPAGVDAQVHLRVPGQEQKETASSGLWAAVAGGVGALLTMPNTKPVLDHPSVLDQARRALEGAVAATHVRVLYSAAMTMGQRGHECVDFEGLARAGVSAFTDDGVGVADDQVMAAVFRGASRTGLPVLQHAEFPGHGGVLAEGPVQRSIGASAYPASAEIEMVRRDLRLLREIPEARYHVLHVSAAETLKLVREARRHGLQVSCEVSPHHLYFTADDIDQQDSSFKMNPPIRSQADRSALRHALSVGDCDFMSTDHAPHEAEVKTSNFKISAFGTTGLETSLRVLIELWRIGQLTSTRLVQIWSTSPAKFLGIDQDFGCIAVGRKFNAVLCDVWAPSTLIMPGDLVGLSKNNCFIGQRLPGCLKATILGTNVHSLDGVLAS